MKIALIGDVHANLPALEAVLAHAQQQGTEAIWNVGDLIGFGAFPDQVVKRVRKENVLSVLGELDGRVLRFKKSKVKWRKEMRVEEYLVLEWAYDNLSKGSRKYLRFLSKEMRTGVKGRRILLTHAGPGSSKKELTPDASKDRLSQLAQEAKADVIVCGHSHRPFAMSAGDVLFVNPGSVGWPRDGRPQASYATLAFKAEDIQVRHHRLEYDVEGAVTAIRDNGLPEVFAQMLLHGLDLDSALQSPD
jgi:putative phosphoesterase